MEYFEIDEVLTIKNGNKESFESAYYNWSGKVYCFVLKQSGSEDIAMEVVQQVFVRLWDKREALSEEHTLSIQLFRMAKTIFVDELRKAAQSRKYVQHIQSKDQLFTENTLEHKEALGIIYRAIDRMPAVRKQIFLMSRMEHLTYKQIAQRLSISPKTVENHIGLALRFLKGISPLLIALQLA